MSIKIIETKKEVQLNELDLGAYFKLTKTDRGIVFQKTDGSDDHEGYDCVDIASGKCYGFKCDLVVIKAIRFDAEVEF